LKQFKINRDRARSQLLAHSNKLDEDVEDESADETMSIKTESLGDHERTEEPLN